MSLLEIGGPRPPVSLRLSRERKTALLPRFRILARWRQTLSEFTAMGMAEVRETREPGLSVFALSSTPILLPAPYVKFREPASNRFRFPTPPPLSGRTGNLSRINRPIR